MADLDLRFDEYTEQYDSKMLERIRTYAREHPLPDRVSVEVGSNRGRFLAQLAEIRPDSFCLGIEIKRSLTRKARKRVRRAGVSNADVICADINLALPILFDDGQIQELFLLYPDPWWKKRHRKRRVIQAEFLDILAPKMAKHGKLWIRTDVGPFADEMRDVLLDHGDFTAMVPDEFPVEPFPITTRERYSFRDEIPANLVYFKRSDGD